MWAKRRVVFVVGLLAMVATLLAAAPAWASSPYNASVSFWKYNPSTGGASAQGTSKAGEQIGYEVRFTSTSALSAQNNDTITFSAPQGTVFPANKSTYYIVSGATGYAVFSDPILSNNGATVTIPLAGSAINIAAGARVSVTMGMFNNHVTNPTTAGGYTLSVKTSRDTTPTTSASYTITPNDPALVSVHGGYGQQAPVREAFAEALSARVFDAYGNVIPGQSVTFAAPDSGPGGTFASTGSATDAATTGADGVATASAFTANSIAGSYEVRATIGGLAPASFSLTNYSTDAAAPTVAAPTVAATRPANKATGVRRGAPLTATFSEAMDAATIDGSTFGLYKVTSGGTKQIANVAVSLSSDGLVATLDPFGASATLLAKNAKYKAVVTTGAEDLAGNGLDQSLALSGGQQKAWTFTTGRR